MVVDATGDCALAHAAGFATIHEGANKQLPMSLYFVLWDTGRPVTPFLPPGCPTWDDDESLPMTTLHVFPSGKVEVKMKVVGFDAADGQSLSRAELHARRQMMGLIYYLQTKGYRRHPTRHPHPRLSLPAHRCPRRTAHCRRISPDRGGRHPCLHVPRRRGSGHLPSRLSLARPSRARRHGHYHHGRAVSHPTAQSSAQRGR